MKKTLGRLGARAAAVELVAAGLVGVAAPANAGIVIIQRIAICANSSPGSAPGGVTPMTASTHATRSVAGNAKTATGST